MADIGNLVIDKLISVEIFDKDTDELIDEWEFERNDAESDNN